jgi:peptide chain release factor 2
MRELEEELNSPEIWKNQEKADTLSRELRSIRARVKPFLEVEENFRSLSELAEIVDDDDTSSLESLRQDAESISKKADEVEFKCLLGGEADNCDAILSVNAGAGGTESCDWASMIFRMYLRWAEEHEMSVEIIDQLSGEEAGLKNATLVIKGYLAYGHLKAEVGVHRLVRISPFDSNKRRHTSFASVDVVPDIDKAIEINIDEGDLRIDTYRSSGAGGQHVNVTDSAVRITHVPTGIVAQCQKERSQHKNKATAMKLLKAKLYDMRRREEEEKVLLSRGNKKKIEWGSQIRSYVFCPYTLVKDHRTGFETGNVEAVIDGEIDGFIEAGLEWLSTAKNENTG